MSLDDEHWTQCTPSEYAWERAALTYLRDQLRNSGIHRGWSNAEFLGQDGSVNEIDLLLVAPAGIAIIEVKSWSGVLTGDAGTWRQTHRGPVDNPVIGANRKARKLKTLLSTRDAMRGLRVPWVEGVVFLSDGHLKVQLRPEGRAHVYGRHDQTDLPSILAFANRPGPVDRQLSAALAKAVDQAGIRQSQRTRTVGSLRLERAAFQEGPGWQDFLGRNPRFPDDRFRRVRIYLASGVETTYRRDQLVRAAEREYLALRGIDHTGIAAPLDFVEHDLGPALVFPHDEKLVRLDHFLDQNERTLSFDDRLVLLRTIAETLAFAHRRVLTHRGLSPRCVWVRQNGERFAVQITDWQTASRGAEPRSTTGAAGAAIVPTPTSTGLIELADDASTAYFAPEWGLGSAKGVALDVFGLGAIAYRIFTGQPPAASFGELSQRLAAHGSLSLVDLADAVPAPLNDLVTDATNADVEHRTRDMAAFMLDLDLVRQRLAEQVETKEIKDPLTAEAGVDLQDGFTVVRRLGQGSTAVALLVERDGQQAVLKVALDDERAARLQAEAETLRALRGHPGVVQLLADDVLEIGGRRAILLSSAGDRTLAQELRERGRLQPEWLHGWGDDLLSIVEDLQNAGLAHRDLKPDNLGIAERGGKGKKRQLVLFDFSLAKAPLDAIDAGTRPYLDPFLGRGDRKRWDPAAERYATAVTLYEMATARQPEYGTHGGHPRFGDADVTIDPELFDRSYASSLTDFFRRALHRDARRRFDTVADMRRAWAVLFTEKPAEQTADATARISRETPIGAAGLARPVLAALERLAVNTVGEALALSRAQVVWLPGIGTKTRLQLVEDLARLAEQVTLSSAERPSAPTLLDRVAGDLIPRDADRAVAEALLGLGEAGGSAWTSVRDAAKNLGLEQKTIRQTVARFERHWLALDGMTELRDTLVQVVEAAGGVASARHCAAALLGFQGSTVDEPLRSRLAEAVVRAAIDTELADQKTDADPRLTYSREEHGILVAAGPPRPEEGPSTAARLEWAGRLGAAADELAGADPLPVSAAVVEALRAVPAPAGTDALLVPADRLLDVAVIAATTAVATPRLEVYPRGLDARRAVRLAAGTLYGADRLTAPEVADRVRARFPLAAALPDHPDLDALLEAAGVPLSWDDEQKLYVAKRAEVTPLTLLTGTTLGSTRLGATTAARARRPGDQASETNQRLERTRADGGWLVLPVHPRRLARAERVLRGWPGVTTIDAEAVLLGAMRDVCASHGVDWQVALESDAAERASADWENLSFVAQSGLKAVRGAIDAAGPAVLVTNPGVLARYDPGLSSLDALRDSVRIATTAAPVRTVWVLVPWADMETQPALDFGAPVPQFGNQRLVLTDSWIKRHESGAADVNLRGVAGGAA
ncbi:BREX system serine/threonine kinase PglW [Pseudofrankia asymbiotica]|uniref:non-specific serine/threonine protein kinase n=1 Tax=Pseudofrankia asymbiotica TaxID=1834516 RepID=A0A1V2HZL5_9ACTN|nr:BREX system serine/threonine kinase PglW [Pseudofrankia asymbiotica]ONH21853.1 hypothetical protein BL253_37620 [Pseudofrankia asymbiotica]